MTYTDPLKNAFFKVNLVRESIRVGEGNIMSRLRKEQIVIA